LVAAAQAEFKTAEAMIVARHALPLLNGQRTVSPRRPLCWQLRTLTFVHSVHILEDMSSGYVSGRVPTRYERLVTKQARAARTSKSDLVARYVIEKSLETEFPGISFRDSISGREAYLTGHRVAVWEVVVVHEETKSADKAARHFGWPRVLVKRALAYAKAFPEEISRASAGETETVSVIG
jgi:uncharacterized protein (DUF433 family)